MTLLSDIRTSAPEPLEPESLEKVVIRMAGDSGDGMQLAGTRFTDASAVFGNDLSTLPAYPSEIRAPAGTIAGVSSFQIQIAARDILTPGDHPDCLVAMNPAALAANIADLRTSGTVVVNSDAFTERNLDKAGYETNPLTDGSLDAYKVIAVPMDSLTKEAVIDSGVSGRDVLRTKNFFALGLLSWLFSRPIESTVSWIESKFAKRPELAAANVSALQAGWTFGYATEATKNTYQVKPAELPAGTYTNVNGNTAIAWGLIAAARQAGLSLFYGTYPITPATDILHELSKHKNFGVRTFQAEDEIAGIGSAIGAAFGGALAVTGTSGPGMALKSESISLAVMADLPLVIVNVQRGGPSTGMPTKPEQADLLFSLFGRHGEAPLPVLAASSPSDAFETAIEAARIALKYMTPVIVLSDNQIANGAEPWRLPKAVDLPDISVAFADRPNGPDHSFLPYLRDPETFSRPWAIPGTAGLEHRLGGLEKDSVSGNVSQNPDNHQLQTDSRAWKIDNIASDIDPVEAAGDADAELLVLGWGSTKGAIGAAARNARLRGHKVATAHLRHVHPFPENLADVLSRYPKILVPEMNSGQLTFLLRARFLCPAVSLSKVTGVPFKVAEIQAKIEEMSS